MFCLFQFALNLALGIDYGFDDLFNDIEVAVHKNEVDLIDIFDVFCEIASLLIYHLPTGDDFRLTVRAILVLLVQFRQILVGEYFLIEGDGILVGLVPGGDAGEFIAVYGISSILLIVHELLLAVSFEFLDDPLTFGSQLLLQFLHILMTYAEDAGEVYS